MTKVMSLVRARDGLAGADFATWWREQYLVSVLEVPLARRMGRAVHQHVQPGEVRPDLPPSAHRWTGVSSYWFDDPADARRLVDDGALAAVAAEHADSLEEVTHLVMDEVLVFDKGVPAPWRMLAFYKRLPTQTRAESLAHYAGVHAELARHPRNPMQRYVQNHAPLDWVNPDERYDYDGGPEAWYRCREDAAALFENPRAMAGSVADEDLFSIRTESLYVYTDEVVVHGPGVVR